jgi:hypothetical protein
MSEPKNKKNLIIFSTISLVVILGITVASVVSFNLDDNNKKEDTSQNSQEEAKQTEKTPTKQNDTQNSQTKLNLEVKNGAQESANYADGEFTASGSYRSPDGTDDIQVSVTLESGIIKSVSVETKPKSTTGNTFQTLFKEGISGQVVGKSIDDVEVSKVNGSSLTGTGFNQAINKIKQEARN